jgi:hypothetical protein
MERLGRWEEISSRTIAGVVCSYRAKGFPAEAIVE